MIFAACVVATQAVAIGVGPAPLAYSGYPGYHGYPGIAKIATPVIAKKVVDDYDPNPQYSYSYQVHVRSNI